MDNTLPLDVRDMFTDEGVVRPRLQHTDAFRESVVERIKEVRDSVLVPGDKAVGDGTLPFIALEDDAIVKEKRPITVRVGDCVDLLPPLSLAVK